MVAKRGHGEGSIYKERSSGKWVAALFVGTEGGKRKKVVRRFKTRKEAAAGLQELQRQHAAGVALNDRTTVEAWLEQWMAESIGDRTESTKRTYTSIITNHIIPYIGSLVLVRLTVNDVQRMVNTIRADSTASNAHYAALILKAALAVAERRGMVVRNVAKLAEAPSRPRYKSQILTPEQARLFLDTAKATSQHYHLYCVALGVGMRQGELIRLEWSHVDLDTGQLEVVQSKTPSGERAIALPGVLVTRLREQRQRVRLLQLAAGSRWTANDLVFPSPDGTPIRASTLREEFKRVLRTAGLPDIRFHDLRHSCASLLIAQGVQPKVVSDILGHSNINITLDTYTHVMKDVQREALERIEQVYA